jgi:hypothetical protein
VNVAAVLSGVQQLEDLPRLIAALGHDPSMEEAPPGTWGQSRVALVGSSGGFSWYGVQTADPARAGRRLAHRLHGLGRPAGVLALNPTVRQLAVAIAFADVPVLELHLAAPHRIALTCLQRLAGPAAGVGGALGYASRAADALAGEAVGQRFFGAFRSTLDRMAAALSGPQADRHAVALLQLTRVLFLYFVQSKGWLDGRPDFLRRAVDRCLLARRHIHRDLLRPLFFGTLNRPSAARGRLPRQFGRIPFLNGGLFEPHQLERRWHLLPNALWRDAFDDLFERFHFTVEEAAGGGLVAPDMLGRVFEGVMEPAARRRSGTFYTPAHLVDALVRTALIAWLSGESGCSEERAERMLDDPDPAARRVLRRITVLDPAVGSGAFLVGALDLLAQGRRPGARRRILRRSLYGVDLNAAAVRLTELRLWLAVIAEDRADSAAEVEPLPNLDALVRQGNSLLDGLGASIGTTGSPLGSRLAQLRARLVTATGNEKRVLARELRGTEVRILTASLDAAAADADRRIATCVADGRSATLFGARRGLDAALRTELAVLRCRRRAIRETRRHLARTGELPWFHCETHFADVFARGGFDVVLGNPPWVRAEQLAPEERGRLAARYHWWRGTGRGFAHQPDLALAFVERGLEVVRPNGVLAMLVPVKIATAGYGARARHALATSTTIHAAVDLVAERGAFDATAYPMALVVSRRRPDPEHAVRPALPLRERAAVPQGTLTGGGPWIIARGPAVRAVLGAAGCSTIGDRFSAHLGVKTGANALFLNPPPTVECSIVRLAVRGRDVRPFRTRDGPRLLWPCDAAGRPLPELPPGARRYLRIHESKLRARADFVAGPAWTLFRTGPASAEHRVVWADLARRLTALALSGSSARQRIPLNTCYVLPVPDGETAHRLAAWLNCSWIRAAARLRATVASGGYARFGAGLVSALPLPDGALHDPELADVSRAAAAGPPDQSRLDDITARHLALTPADRSALASVAGVADDRR